MARKPSDIVQPNLRIREDLRRRLEAAAKKQGVSINQEMTRRLLESFERGDLLKLSLVAERLQRFAADVEARSLQEDLMLAAEALIKQLPADMQQRSSVKAVQKAIDAIWARVGRMPLEERE